jgi:hypothetical protein
MFINDITNKRSRYSSVSIVTRLGAGRSGFNSPEGQGIFSSLPPRPDWFWGTHSLLSSGYRGSLPEGKAVGPLSSAEVKNARS